MEFRFMPVLSTAALFFALAAAASACGSDRVTVRLTDGRTFSGRIDPRTGNNLLWLRFGNETIKLLRPVAWDAVAAAEHEGHAVTSEQLRSLAASLAANPPAEPSKDRGPLPAMSAPGSDSAERLGGASFAEANSRPNDAKRARDALGPSPRVASVDFDVCLANWDSDVEMDGLVVHVYPLDNRGLPTDAAGTLEAELFGPPPRGAETPARAGQSLRRLGQWSIPAHVAGAAGGVFKLPFQAVHPEFDTRTSAYGLVNVRLTVPGQGVFSASRDGVRIRPYSPLRDALERHGGQRFLPQEPTGRGKR